MTLVVRIIKANQHGVLTINPDITIKLHRKLTKCNISDILHISETTLGKNYFITSDIKHQSYRWILATNTHGVIGFACIINDHSDATITDVAVHPRYQGSGIATNLIAQCVFEISTLWVENIECFAWETKGYPHLKKPLMRNSFEIVGTEPRIHGDYRKSFECPSCGFGCSCNTTVFRRKTDLSHIPGF